MLYSANDALDGWDTYAEWEKEGFQRTSSTASLKRVHVKLGCPLLRFKDVCKRDMKSAAIDIESGKLMVKDRSTLRHLVKEEIKHAENTRNVR